MTDLHVRYDRAETVAEMIEWLVDNDTIELRDLALNLLSDVETLRAERDAARAQFSATKDALRESIRAAPALRAAALREAADDVEKWWQVRDSPGSAINEWLGKWLRARADRIGGAT